MVERVLFGPGGATEAKQDAQLASYNVEVAEGAPGVTYVGEAPPGSDGNQAVWRIKRMTETGADVSIEWADGNSDFDNIWDNRASLTYD